MAFSGAGYLYTSAAICREDRGDRWRILSALVLDKYRIDELYGAMIVQPLMMDFHQRFLARH